MQPHPLREMFADHSCENCRYPERGCTRMRLNTCQEFQPNDDAIFREIVHLKIALLRRMAERAGMPSAWRRQQMACLAWASRRAAALDRFRSACLTKIAEIWSVESRYRAQRKADRIRRRADEIAKASNVPHHLCGMDKP